MVLSFVNGGELFLHLQEAGKFEEYRSKFYTAELLLCLEYLHSYNIIYRLLTFHLLFLPTYIGKPMLSFCRDVKPENILLDYNGHIALCDFGLCKMHMTKGEKTNTFCGTPEYLVFPSLFNEQTNSIQPNPNNPGPRITNWRWRIYKRCRLVDPWNFVVRNVDWAPSILLGRFKWNVQKNCWRRSHFSIWGFSPGSWPALKGIFLFVPSSFPFPLFHKLLLLAPRKKPFKKTRSKRSPGN